MRLPPLCRYFRGGVTTFRLNFIFEILLKPRGADLESLLGVCLGSCVDTFVFEGPFRARGADLGSLLADLGSLLGVSFGYGYKSQL